MAFRRITGICLPAIAGELLRQIHHDAIAGDLGHDRRRRDRQRTGISLDHGKRGYSIAGRDHIAVDQQVVRSARQPVDRAQHGQVTGAQDVDFVDLFDAGMSHRHVGAGHDRVKNSGAPFGGQLLGIIQPLGDVARIQHHGGGRHGPGQRAAPHFIHPCHARGSLRKRARFQRIVRHIHPH